MTAKAALTRDLELPASDFCIFFTSSIVKPWCFLKEVNFPGGGGYDGKTWSISRFPKSNCKLTKRYVFRSGDLCFFICFIFFLIRAIKK